MEKLDKWRCDGCHEIFCHSEMLEGQSPFDIRYMLLGCPHCKLFGEFTQICYVANCKAVATSRTPTKFGYLRCCVKHYEKYRYE